MASVLFRPYDHKEGNLIFDNFPVAHVIDTKIGKIRDRHVIVRDSVFPVTTLVGELSWRADRAEKHSAEDLRNSVARLKSPSRQIWVNQAGTIVEWTAPMQQREIDAFLDGLLASANFVKGGRAQTALNYSTQFALTANYCNAYLGQIYTPVYLDTTGPILRGVVGTTITDLGDTSYYCGNQQLKDWVRSLPRDDRTVAVPAFNVIQIALADKAKFTAVVGDGAQIEFGRIYPRYKDLTMVSLPLVPSLFENYDKPLKFDGAATSNGFMGFATAFTWINGRNADVCLFVGGKQSCNEARGVPSSFGNPQVLRFNKPVVHTLFNGGGVSPLPSYDQLWDNNGSPNQASEYDARTVARAPTLPLTYGTATLTVADWIANRRANRTSMPDDAVRYGYDVTVSPISDVSLVGYSIASFSETENSRYTVIEVPTMRVLIPSTMMASYLSSLTVGASASQKAEVEKVVIALTDNPTNYGIVLQDGHVSLSPQTLDYTETSKIAKKADMTLRDEEMFPAQDGKPSQTFGDIEKLFIKRVTKPVSWYFFSKAVAGIAGVVSRAAYTLVWSYDVALDKIYVQNKGIPGVTEVLFNEDDPLLVTLHDWTRDGSPWEYDASIPGASDSLKEAWVAGTLFGTQTRAEIEQNYSLDTSERGGEWDLDPIINSAEPVRIENLTPAQAFLLFGTEATDIARLALTLTTNWVQDGTYLPWDEQQVAYEANPIVIPADYDVSPTT